MIKRLGGRSWRNLHRLVYAIGVLALVHYFMQSKLNVAEPAAAAGLFLWLMSYRAMGRSRPEGVMPAWTLLLLAIGAGLATGVGEALYYGLATGVDARRVLAADWHWPFLARPCWVVSWSVWPLQVWRPSGASGASDRPRGWPMRRPDPLSTGC